MGIFERLTKKPNENAKLAQLPKREIDPDSQVWIDITLAMKEGLALNGTTAPVILRLEDGALRLVCTKPNVITSISTTSPELVERYLREMDASERLDRQIARSINPSLSLRERLSKLPPSGKIDFYKAALGYFDNPRKLHEILCQASAKPFQGHSLTIPFQNQPVVACVSATDKILYGFNDLLVKTQLVDQEDGRVHPVCYAAACR